MTGEIRTKMMRVGDRPGSNEETLAMSMWLGDRGQQLRFPDKANTFAMVAVDAPVDGPAEYDPRTDTIVGVMTAGIDKKGSDIGQVVVDDIEASDADRVAALTVLGEKVLLMEELYTGRETTPAEEVDAFRTLGKMADVAYFAEIDA